MHFRELYNLVEAQKLNKPVGFEFLRTAVVESVAWVEDVSVWRLVYNPPRREAHFMLFDDRSSAYNGEYLVVDISYCATLESDPSELIFALCKELMHVFDDRQTWIDTREKFVQFLKDLQNTPLDHKNGALGSEHRAKWMALLVLCPKSLRENIRTEIAEGRALRIEVAERLGLPEWFIETALDDYYDEALRILTT